MTNPIIRENLNEASMNAAFESNILKEKMSRAAERCGNALLYFYHVSDNSGHEKKMKYMLKDLFYTKTEEAEYICEQIYEEADTHLVAAMKYGYTAKDLAELRSCIDAYRALINNKPQVVMSKKTLEDVMESFRTMGRRAG